MENMDYYFIFIIAFVELVMFSFLINNMHRTRKTLNNYLALEKMRKIKRDEEHQKVEIMKMEMDKITEELKESQVQEFIPPKPKKIEPWECIICDELNTLNDSSCQRCGSQKY